MIYKHLLSIYNIVIIFKIICITSKNSINWKNSPMTWPENPNDKDIFADKVVSINLDLATTTLRNGTETVENHTVIATGVLISNYQVLTSYNAFRELARNNNNMKSIVVAALKERVYHEPDVTYNVAYSHIICGRQVIPMGDNDIKEDDWHGKDHLHSPLHDLMILRLAENLKLEDENKNLSNTTDESKDVSKKLTGPLSTVLAKTDQAIGRDVKIASIGHENEKHINKNVDLLRHDYDPEDNVIVDCDQWIPRQWGHFICLRNIHDFKALGSGAVLFYNSTLYGIGSFALRKGKKGILVFTDVRRYYSLINEACTTTDQI